MPLILGSVDKTVLFKVLQNFFNLQTAKFLPLAERQFKYGAFDVVEQNLQVIRIHESMLGRLSKEVGRILMINWSREHCRYQTAAEVPERLPNVWPLPGGGNGPGIACHNAYFET
jgi:hypothetical protein